jgi:hypothetical protein
LLGETRLVAAVNATALVHLCRKLVGAANRPTAQSTKGFVRGRCNDRGDRNRTLAAHKDTSSDQPGEVGTGFVQVNTGLVTPRVRRDKKFPTFFLLSDTE